MGLATVNRFLVEGASVVIADLNSQTGEAAVAEATKAGYGEKVAFVRTDVANEDDVAQAIGQAVEKFGGLDIVFNNAGVGGAIGPLTETTVDDFDYTFNVLAKGVFLGIKHAARVMQAAGRGGAKAAVISLTRSAAVELARDRIRVNAICPGFIVTPLADGGNPEATKKRFIESQPWPDYGRGEHIAGAALFLASDDAEFVTGEEIVVDGGLTAAGPELSRKFPKTSARDARVSGITKGSTGEPHEIRRL